MNTKLLASKLLQEYVLCDWCLGRQFPFWMNNLSSKERGKRLRKGIDTKQAMNSNCYICQGIMPSIEEFAQKVLEAIKSYEFETFLVGASVPSSIVEREDQLRSNFKLKGGESIKGDITRTIGTLISDRTGKRVSYRKPDLTILVKPAEGSLRISTKPVYLFGRYVKKRRGIPQKKRICKLCGGLGYKECEGTGLSPTLSVEKLLADKLMASFKARDVRFTWIGGEDTNSLVLGKGRPFFAELVDPMIRSLSDFKPLYRSEAGVRLKELRVVNKPTERPEFTVTVLARVRFSKKVDEQVLKSLEEEFTDKTVTSFSSRKRRLVEKKVHRLSVKRVRGRAVELEVVCDGGLSIRKLILGEVSPSLADVLGFPIMLDEKRPFDVLDIDIHNIN